MATVQIVHPMRGHAVGDIVDLDAAAARQLVLEGRAVHHDPTSPGNQPEDPTPARPADSALKDEWVAYAEQLGVATGGLTVDELKAETAAIDGSDTTNEEEASDG